MGHRQLSVTRLLAAVLACLLALPAAWAGSAVYQWKDAQGRTHFSDRDPAAGSTALKSFGSTPSREEARFAVSVTAHGYHLSAQSRARLEEGVHRIFDVYTGVFRLDMRHHVNVDIHLFASEQEMKAHLLQRDPQLRLPAGIYGLYIPRLDAIFAWAHGDGEDELLATLWHETSHAMLERLAPAAPPWLHEGLAEYFEGMQPGDGTGQLRIAPTEGPLSVIEQMVEAKRVIALRDYFALPPDRWRQLAHDEGNPLPYSVAWSVTYFLMSRPVGQQIVRELLHDLEKSRTSPTFDTIQRRYPGGYALMEYDWFKWAQSAKPPQVLRW